MDGPNTQSAIFLMPRSSSSWKGAEAIWITVGGWALAAEKVLGKALVVTTDRVASPREVLAYPLDNNNRRKTGKDKKRGFIPAFLKVFIKDVLLFKRSRRRVTEQENAIGGNIRFIWEQHDLFANKGKILSQKHEVPLVKFVHAPIVWEASKWGVKRYFWGKILERMEAYALRKAHVILTVSKEVKRKLIEMGIDEEKIIVSPMGVNPELFEEKKDRVKELKKKYNLEEKLVIGWIGSFRKFHGIDQVITAFAKVAEKFPEVKLMLVGEGSEREKAELLTSKLDLQDKIIFTGQIKYAEIPNYISLFEIAVVSAERGEEFHYSPLKLREYMVMGKPVIAPRAGEIPEKFEEEINIKLFEPGNVDDITMSIINLLTDENKRIWLGSRGKKRILEQGTWEVELKKLLTHLEN